MQPNHKPNQQPQPNNRKQSLAKYAKFSAFAFQMIGTFVALSLGGNWLDKHYQFKFPYFTLLGVLVALVAIFYSLFSLVNRPDEDELK